MPHERVAIAIVVSAGGSLLDEAALREVPLARVIAADIASTGASGCAAVLVGHACSPATLQAACHRWGASRGWRVTVAPVHAAN